jgi:type II secretory pathway pseudopilin PulG
LILTLSDFRKLIKYLKVEVEVNYMPRLRLRNSTAGFALLDTLIAITIFLLMTPVIVVYLNLSSNTMLQKAAASQMSLVVEAAERYISANFDDLQSDATATHAVEVSWSELQDAGLLSDTLKNSTAYGQTYRVWVLEPSTDVLEGYVITYGGSSTQTDSDFMSLQIPATASYLGAKGGYFDSGLLTTGTLSATASIAQGAFGGWSFDFSTTDITLPHAADSEVWNAGHLVATTAYAESFENDEEFLHRLPATDSAMNAMATDLSMKVNGIEHDITDADNILASGKVQGSYFSDADNSAYYMNPNGGSWFYGDLRLEAGDLTLAKGDAQIAIGDVDVLAGDVNLDAGDINVSKGDIEVTDGNIRVEDGDIYLGARNIWLSDAISKYVHQGTYIVRDYSTSSSYGLVAKPACPVPGSSSSTSTSRDYARIVLTPLTNYNRTYSYKTQHHAWTMAANTYNTNYWKIYLRTYTSTDGSNSNDSYSWALAHVYCYVP